MAIELFGHCTGASRNRLAIVPARAVINYAAASKLCQPIRIEKFKVETAEKGFATLEWVQDFRKEASPQLGGFALFMFLTGARPSEALEADINLSKATALIRASKVGHEREAHLPEMLVVALANIPMIEGRSLFFYSSLDSLYPAWFTAVDRAGLERLTPHCCRHGFITGLLRAGKDVKTVEWLADVSAETLLRTYAHAIKDRRQTDVLTDTLVTQPIVESARNRRKIGTT
jgi:integrase